jgi:hypothetical protein
VPNALVVAPGKKSSTGCWPVGKFLKRFGPRPQRSKNFTSENTAGELSAAAACHHNPDGLNFGNLRVELYIGITDTTGWGFDGRIDDVRIYNRVLTREEIKRLYTMGR